jgi:hypothetical protein
MIILQLSEVLTVYILALLSLQMAPENSSSFIEYFEIDYHPLDGVSYYRLVQTDYDGISAASQPVAVRTYSHLAGELSLFPNPTDGSFHLQITGFGDEEFVVVVRDITGREHYSKVIVTSTDRHLEAIDPANKLAAGTYIVTASSRNEFYSQKLVVKISLLKKILNSNNPFLCQFLN